MSTADELLDSLSDDEIIAYTSTPETEPHIVIGADRYITVPDSLKRIAIQYDHDIETVTFDCPRYWDEHDMSKMIIYIVYERPDKETGEYRAKNVRINETDETIMHFDWTLENTVTPVAGSLSIQVCIRKTDSEGNESDHWNSEINTQCTISKSLTHNHTVIEQEYPDVVTQIFQEIDELRDEVNAGISYTYDGSYADEEYTTDGMTYYIKVSDNTPLITDLVGASLTVNTDGNDNTITLTEDNIVQYDSYFACENNGFDYVYVVTAESVSWGGATLTKGVWFIDYTHDSGSDNPSYTKSLVEANEKIDMSEYDTRISTLEQQVADLQYEEIAISSFTNNVGTVEMGSTVDTVTLSWKLNKTAASLSIDGVAQDVTANSVVYTDLGLTENKTWTMVAIDERDATATKSTGVTFYNGVYYGAATEPEEYNDEFIINLGSSGKKVLTGKKIASITVTSGADEYYYYCLPARFGVCAFDSGIGVGGFDLVMQYDFTNASGYNEPYLIYKSTQPNLGTTTYSVT